MVGSKILATGPATLFQISDLLPWEWIDFHIEVNLLSWKSIHFHGNSHGGRWKLIFPSMENSMEVSGSFHGNTWNFPLSVEVGASIASINCSFHEYIPWKLPRASIFPYVIPSISTNITNFQLLPQDFHKGPSTSVRSTCIEVSTTSMVPWK